MPWLLVPEKISSVTVGLFARQKLIIILSIGVPFHKIKALVNRAKAVKNVTVKSPLMLTLVGNCRYPAFNFSKMRNGQTNPPSGFSFSSDRVIKMMRNYAEVYQV